MKKGNDYNRKGTLSLLLMGTPKSGKTVVAMSFPKPFILDCDNNLRGALKYHEERGEPIKDFYFADPNAESLEKRWDFCLKSLEEAIESDEVESIIIDGLSLLSEYLQAMILANTKGDSTQGSLTIGGEKCMMQSHWTPFKTRMARLVMACKASNKPFIMTCHTGGVLRKDGSLESYRPLISGQMRDNIAGFFSDCWLCEAKASMKQPTYSIRTAPKNLYQIGNSLSLKDVDFDTTNKKASDIWSYISKNL